jgi:putative SOS response-associated peptidase YedK
MASWREVHAFSQPLTVSPSQPSELIVSTPMRFAQIMRLKANGQRELASMRWGFADKKANAPLRPKHMHARAETVDRLPTFAEAFAHARGILMVHTFNEGEELPNGKTKQWVITPQDGQPIAIAVICEQWQNGAETLDTFVQVTVAANNLISRITDRMPAILPRDAWPLWLGETGAPNEEVKGLLRTYEDGGSWTMTEQTTNKPPRRPEAQQSLF